MCRNRRRLSAIRCTPSRRWSRPGPSCSGTSATPSHSSPSPPQLARQFKHKLTPCCESVDPKGYCGQLGEETWCLAASEGPLHAPESHFCWDDAHPTQAAGWEAVMQQLEDPIKQFLGLN